MLDGSFRFCSVCVMCLCARRCPLGAFGRQEAIPPLAGATLHPGEDDAGHVHPHVAVTGQLPQHQAVHVAVKSR